MSILMKDSSVQTKLWTHSGEVSVREMTTSFSLTDVPPGIIFPILLAVTPRAYTSLQNPWSQPGAPKAYFSYHFQSHKYHLAADSARMEAMLPIMHLNL